MENENDIQSAFKESIKENWIIIKNIIEQNDTRDLLFKLIALNQLNSYNEIINGLGYSLIEKYILMTRDTFSKNKNKQVSETELVTFIDSYVAYLFQTKFIDKFDLKNKSTIEYDSFVDLNQDVKGDAFPEQIFNQNFEILKMISDSFEYHIGKDFISFFKFFTIMKHLFFLKFSSYYDKNDIEKITTKEELVNEVFTNSLYKNLFIEEYEIQEYKLPNEDTLTHKEIEFYLELYSRDIKDKRYENFSDIEKYPILKFDEQLLVLHHHYFTWNQTDKIIELMKTNERLYQKYNKARGDWLEEKTYKYLLNVFNKKYVFRNPNYYVDGELHESDIFIDYCDTLMIFECKSQHVRTQSKTGSVSRFRKDIKNILEDAYEQADRLRKNIAKTLINDDFVIFKEDGKTQVHRVSKGSPDRIIMINISFDNLKALGTMLNQFHKDGLYRKGVDIVSFNIHDFAFISDFLDKPYLFLDYVIKRIEKVQKYHVVDELDYLGWYHETLLNQDFEQDFTFIHLAEDYIPYFQKYLHGVEKKLVLKANNQWLEFLDKLSVTDFPRKSLLELGLLSMQNDGISKIIEQISIFQNDPDILSGEKAKIFTIIPKDEKDPNMVITFVYVSENNYSETLFLKARNKVKQAFQRSKKLHWYTLVLYSKEIKVKKVIYESSGIFFKVGRNDLCPCGSGLKYKKCCL